MKPEVTGPDYLIAAAKKLSDEHGARFPYIQHFLDFTSEFILSDQSLRFDALKPHEQTAVRIMNVGLQALIATNPGGDFFTYVNQMSALMIRFEEFLEKTHRKYGPDDDREIALDTMPWE